MEAEGGVSGRTGWPRTAMVVFVNVVLAFLLAEFAVRAGSVVSRQVRRLVFQRTTMAADELASAATTRDLLDRAVWWPGPKARCYGYVLNSRGFRAPEYTVEKPRGSRRVVLLGDSFLVEAGGVRDEDHVATLLGGALAKAGSPEVVNLGVPGVGTHFEVRLFELEGAALAPDDVVLFLFVGNDITDEPAVLPPEPPMRALLDRSAVWRFGRNLRRAAEWQGTLEAGGPRADRRGRGGYYAGYPGQYPPEPPLSRKAWMSLVVEKGRIWMDPWPDDLEADWRSVEEALKRLRDGVRVAGARLLVVVIPDETQLSENLRTAVTAAYPGADFDFDRPQRVIAEACRRARIPVLDLLPAFRAAGGELYMPRDTHWNPEGQKIAASLLARRLALR